MQSVVPNPLTCAVAAAGYTRATSSRRTSTGTRRITRSSSTISMATADESRPTTHPRISTAAASAMLPLIG
jgi:hypothetical protein